MGQWLDPMLPMQEARVPFLGGELRSCKPHTARSKARKPVPGLMEVSGRHSGKAKPFASCDWGKSLCLGSMVHGNLPGNRSPGNILAGVGAVLRLTPPFAHRARMLALTPVPLRMLWAVPAAECISPSWPCLSSPPCPGTAACASGTGCGFTVRPEAALHPESAGRSTTGWSQVSARWGRVGQGPGTLGG